MDQAIIQYYRRLLSRDFEHAGSIDHPSIFVEAIGERMIHCGNSGNFMQLYLNVSSGTITDIRYLCSCEPAANVAVEVLCTLVKGKSLEEAASLPQDAFYRFLNCKAEEYAVKVRGLLEMLREGIREYETRSPSPDKPAESIQW